VALGLCNLTLAEPVVKSLCRHSKNLGDFVGQHVRILSRNHELIIWSASGQVKDKLGKVYNPYNSYSIRCTLIVVGCDGGIPLLSGVLRMTGFDPGAAFRLAAGFSPPLSASDSSTLLRDE
jgi:hypothetical protein